MSTLKLRTESMIGKLIQGTDFQGCLSYVLDKLGADRLGGNAIGSTVTELTSEFDRLRQRRPTLNQAVYHLSLSLAPGEFLSDSAWDDLVQQYLGRMNITRNPYVLVRHTDTDCDHVHIVASRIRYDGSVIDDSWDYTRSQAILRDLEAEYNLNPVAPSQSTDRRAATRRQLEKEKQTGQPTAKATLQRLINEAIPLATTLADLRDRLEEKAVSTRFTYSKNGILKGISFAYEGIALAGHHLGQAYSLPALRRRLPVPDEVEARSSISAQAAQIQTAIESNTATSLGEFIDQLQQRGVTVHLKSKRRSRQRQVSSFSYAIGSVSFLDSDLGDGDEFTFRQLRQRQFANEDLLLAPFVSSVEPEVQSTSPTRQLYEFLAKSLSRDGQARSPEELDQDIARYLVQNGTQADVKALVYSPQFQRLKQQDLDQAERYLRELLQTALQEQQASSTEHQQTGR